MTDQEQAIYDALMAGDQDAINVMRESLETAEEIQQFNLDYQNAWLAYQAEHEMPEEERIEATAEQVKVDNENAPEENSGEVDET